jgi:hypothetical protein
VGRYTHPSKTRVKRPLEKDDTGITHTHTQDPVTRRHDHTRRKDDGSIGCCAARAVIITLRMSVGLVGEINPHNTRPTTHSRQSEPRPTTGTRTGMVSYYCTMPGQHPSCFTREGCYEEERSEDSERAEVPRFWRRLMFLGS